MSIRPIRITSFTGMNNIKSSEGLFADRRRGIAEPRIVLNADVTEQGRIEKRDGYTEVVTLPNCHSMWAGDTCMLAMSGSVIKRITGEVAATIEDIGGLRRPMYYAEIGDKVYMSNSGWNGIFDPQTDLISTWGVAPPEGPVMSFGNGGLPAGTYHVFMTNESGEEISGNGPVSKITLAGTGGILISNRPSEATVWCTDPNGVDVFYRIGKTDTIDNVSKVEPFPFLFCSQPPYMENITHAFGRMWGSQGNILYYSEPLHVDLFRLGQSRFKFATDITLIAKVKTGLFVGCKDRTKFYSGTKPDQMQELDVGAGAIPGTLVYCNNIIELGDTISPPEKKHNSVPVWVSEEGIVAGNPAGRLFSLSQQKVKFAPGVEGASLYRKKDGRFQFLTSFKQGSEGSGLGFSDTVTAEVMRNGVVI